MPILFWGFLITEPLSPSSPDTKGLNTPDSKPYSESPIPLNSGAYLEISGLDGMIYGLRWVVGSLIKGIGHWALGYDTLQDAKPQQSRQVDLEQDRERPEIRTPLYPNPCRPLHS